MNRATYRYAVLFIGATLILSVVGIVALAWGAVEGSQRIPDILQSIASGSLGGLLGLLVTPRE